MGFGPHTASLWSITRFVPDTLAISRPVLSLTSMSPTWRCRPRWIRRHSAISSPSQATAMRLALSSVVAVVYPAARTELEALTSARSAKLMTTPPWTALVASVAFRWRWRMGIRTRAQPSELASSIHAKVSLMLDGSEFLGKSICLAIASEDMSRLGFPGSVSDRFRACQHEIHFNGLSVG